MINVASAAHLWGSINLANPSLKGEYQNWKAYGQSKLANVMFTFELAKRLPAAANISTNTLHPGIVNTELARCVCLSMFVPCCCFSCLFWTACHAVLSPSTIG